METKRCNTCGELKPVAAFHRSGKTRNGYVGICKLCTSERRRKKGSRRSRHAYYSPLLDETSPASIDEAIAELQKASDEDFARGWPAVVVDTLMMEWADRTWAGEIEWKRLIDLFCAIRQRYGGMVPRPPAIAASRPAPRPKARTVTEPKPPPSHNRRVQSILHRMGAA